MWLLRYNFLIRQVQKVLQLGGGHRQKLNTKPFAVQEYATRSYKKPSLTNGEFLQNTSEVQKEYYLCSLRAPAPVQRLNQAGLLCFGLYFIWVLYSALPRHVAPFTSLTGLRRRCYNNC